MFSCCDIKNDDKDDNDEEETSELNVEWEVNEWQEEDIYAVDILSKKIEEELWQEGKTVFFLYGTTTK